MDTKNNLAMKPEYQDDGREDVSEEYSEDEMQMQLQEKLQLFGTDLLRRADEQVALKVELETRWIDDLRHYNGKYDASTSQKINKGENKSSTIFVNLTRSKTNLAEAKLSDMILPTDDRNWGIKPTPVPQMQQLEENEEPIQLVDGSVAVNPATGEPYTYKDLAKIKNETAAKRADRMQEEIDDQLTESKHNANCRDVIHHACTVGTGIIKGPMVTKRQRKSWQQVEGGGYMLTMTNEHKPLSESVDPWNFFPEMSAVTWEDVEFVFERHLLTKKKVRDLLKRPGFMKEQVKDLLREDPTTHRSNLNYLNELREINGINHQTQDNRYEIWEYHGPIDKENLIACGCDVDPDDPLEEIEGVVWFSGTRVLKVAMNHLDDGGLPYSVFNWEKDDTSVFGFGVPYRMRASQKVMNGAWRMLLDNAGLSTGPQIVINRKIVEPADGVWELAPRKLWYLTNEKYNVQEAFGTFEINSHQQELAAIFEMAHQLADEETSLPQLGNQMQEENTPAVMKTLGGTALWMSSQNIMMRRAVKNWDDDITIPFITRMYYWNMQFNPKDEIKGDYDVDARGTSVLMVKEMQMQNMMELVGIAGQLPGGMESVNTHELLKVAAKSMQIPEGSILKSDEEIEEMGNQPPPPDPEQIKADAQAQIEQQKAQTNMQMAQLSLQEKMVESENSYQEKLIDREIQMSKLAVEQDKTIAQLLKDYDLKTLEHEWDREKFYQEIGLKREGGNLANIGLGP